MKKHSQDVVQSFIDRVNDEFMEILQLATSAMNSERSQDQISELLLKGKALSSEVQQFQEKHPSRSELIQLKARWYISLRLLNRVNYFIIAPFFR